MQPLHLRNDVGNNMEVMNSFSGTMKEALQAIQEFVEDGLEKKARVYTLESGDTNRRANPYPGRVKDILADLTGRVVDHQGDQDWLVENDDGKPCRVFSMFVYDYKLVLEVSPVEAE